MKKYLLNHPQTCVVPFGRRRNWSNSDKRQIPMSEKYNSLTYAPASILISVNYLCDLACVHVFFILAWPWIPGLSNMRFCVMFSRIFWKKFWQRRNQQKSEFLAKSSCTHWNENKKKSTFILLNIIIYRLHFCVHIIYSNYSIGKHIHSNKSMQA